MPTYQYKVRQTYTTNGGSIVNLDSYTLQFSLQLGCIFFLTASVAINLYRIGKLEKEVKELKQNVDHLYTDKTRPNGGTHS